MVPIIDSNAKSRTILSPELLQNDKAIKSVSLQIDALWIRFR